MATGIDNGMIGSVESFGAEHTQQEGAVQQHIGEPLSVGQSSERLLVPPTKVIVPVRETARQDVFTDIVAGGASLDLTPTKVTATVDTGVFSAEIDSMGLVHFHIRTIGEDGRRLPLFDRYRAGDLAGRAIHHFAKQTEVKGIAFDWIRPQTDLPRHRSDNYTTYVCTRNALAQTVPPDESKRLAVHATWTYNRIAAPHGFTHIEPAAITEVGPATNLVSIKGVLVGADRAGY